MSAQSRQPARRFGAPKSALKQRSLRRIRRRLAIESLEDRRMLAVAIGMNPADDSGVLDSDRITNVVAPRFEVTVSEPGVIGVDFTGDGMSDVQQSVDAAGTYEFRSPTQADGEHTITASVTPLTGDPSSASVAVTIDTKGPKLLTGTLVAAAPLSQRTLTFDEAIDLRTLSTHDIVLTTPNGIEASPVSVVAAIITTFTVEFVSLTTPGHYSLAVAPRASDLAGNAIDQNGNGTGGEPGEDLATDAFTVLANPTWLTQATTIDAQNMTYENSDLVIDNTTLTVTGQHVFRSIWVINHSLVTHSPGNATGMHLAVDDWLAVDGTSRISADAGGHAGGMGPGKGSGDMWSGGGGGYGGTGAAAGGSGGGTYGSSTEPTELGSGGGPRFGAAGGTGGGSIRLVAGTLKLDGQISANGTAGPSATGGGSGGSIWVTAGTLSGSGEFHADGGSATDGGGGGGGGRVAVYFQAGDEYRGESASTAAGRSGGGAGTIGFFDESVPNGHLRVYERFALAQDAVVQYAAITLAQDARLDVTGTTAIQADAVTLNNGATVGVIGALTIEADALIMGAGARISADGGGYAGGQGRGKGSGDMSSGGGGGYGGIGAAAGGSGGGTYGSSTEPTELGSGGGPRFGAAGGTGGGSIRLIAGTLKLDGQISANGTAGPSATGGGSGGSIWVTAGTLSGSGEFHADGGSATDGGGGGGGGRIAVYSDDASGFTGFGSSTAFGGSAGNSGGAGTIVVWTGIDQTQFAASEGDTIYFDVQDLRGGTARFAIRTPNGDFLFESSGSPGSPDSADRGPFILEEPGTYTTIVYSEFSAPLDYEARIWTVPPDRVRPVNVSDVITAVIQTPGAVDKWEFTAAANRTISLDVRSITGAGQLLDFSLLAPDGSTVFATTGSSGNPTAANYGATTLPQAGTYTLVVKGRGDDAPGYQFAIVGAGLPRIVSHSAAGATPGTIDAVWFRFNQGMDQTSFGLDQDIVSFVGPNGPITPTDFSWHDPQTLIVSFTPQVATASYQLTVGPNILNPAGETLDQNRNQIGGEVPNDQYTAAVEPTTIALDQKVLGRIDSAFSFERWAFFGAAGQQVRFDRLAASSPNTVFDLTGPDGWTGFVGLATASQAVTLPGPGTYVLTARSTGEQWRGTYSFVIRDTSQTPLDLGAPFNGILQSSGQSQVFRLNLLQSLPLTIRLDDANAGDHNELYAKFGGPPTRDDYDYRFSNSAASNQEISIPSAAVGTWYILAYADYVTAPSNFTLLAAVSDLLFSTSGPAAQRDDVDAVLDITGAAFDQADAFQIIEAGQPDIQTRLILPSALGWHQLATLYVEYTNAGEVAAPAPLLVLTVKVDQSQRSSRSTLPGWTRVAPRRYSRTGGRTAICSKTTSPPRAK